MEEEQVCTHARTHSLTHSITHSLTQYHSLNITHSLTHCHSDIKGPIDLIFPPVSLCTDNGVMAAWAGIEKLVLGISDPIEEQEAVARWPLGSQIMNPVFTKRDKEKRNKGGPE